MLEIQFQDEKALKYTWIDQFKEGLALVKNRENLYGYIDKTGKEVIACQFKLAYQFQEGYAVVQDANNQFGYINKNGGLVIPCQFYFAYPFKEGLAAVQNNQKKFGYIDKKGTMVIPYQFAFASYFHDGYAQILSSPSMDRKYINRNGDICLEDIDFGTAFGDGNAIIKRGTNFLLIDSFLTVQKRMTDLKVAHCSAPSSLMIKAIDNRGRVGYFDQNFNLIIPFIYVLGNDFKEDVAIVSYDEETIGFVTKDGKHIMFSKKHQYMKLDDFSGGLARVQNAEGLWGYIDKNGREVIPCQYMQALPFQEGLAGVMDQNENYYYIDQKGCKKIKIPYLYHSILQLETIFMFLEAENREQFVQKKLELLETVKTEALRRVAEDVETAKVKSKKS